MIASTRGLLTWHVIRYGRIIQTHFGPLSLKIRFRSRLTIRMCGSAQQRGFSPRRYVWNIMRVIEPTAQGQDITLTVTRRKIQSKSVPGSHDSNPKTRVLVITVRFKANLGTNNKSPSNNQPTSNGSGLAVMTSASLRGSSLEGCMTVASTVRPIKYHQLSPTCYCVIITLVRNASLLSLFIQDHLTVICVLR